MPATKGLYVGSTLAPSWQDRIAVGDLGYRTKAVLTRYPEGIMLQRSGGRPIWIPDESITAIRTERGIAGKALTHQGILAIRWRLPSGTEIDTGFRGENRADYAQWLGGGGGVSSKALLVLDDGRIFTGTPFGALGQTLGEAVFSTGMSGYQETLTDPSYHRQIVVATAPQIGNTGWNHEDAESRGDKIWVAGYAVRDPSPRASNWRATGTLDDELVRQGIVGIAGIDTRAVVRHLRSLRFDEGGGVLRSRMRARPTLRTSCWTGSAASRRCWAPTWPARSAPTTPTSSKPKGRNGSPSPRSTWASRPTRRATSPVAASAATCCRRRRPSTRSPTSSPTVCSCPTGPETPRPPTTSSASPARCSAPGIPLFGICFGNQILGRALGRSTYKMVFGHRGINVPVIDHATGRVAVTAQNHGFALEGEAGEQFDTPFGTRRGQPHLRQRRRGRRDQTR